jgi:hypothetical protein
MRRCLSMIAVLAVLTGGAFAEEQTKDAKDSKDAKGKVCRMEQQCHWESFKKICTRVKVCR